MPNSDDPFVQPEPTRARPRPGAGRRTFVGPSRPQSPPPPDESPLTLGSVPTIDVGLNPLVRAASHLLLLTAQIRETRSQMDASGLRRHALDEIRRFEEQARTARVSNEVVLSARYALCAGLDEAVLSTPWGNQSEWAHHPLLVALSVWMWRLPQDNCKRPLIDSGAGSIVLPKRQNYELRFIF